MAGDFKPQPRVKNALDNNKFHLTAPNSKGKNASFQISLNQTATGQNEGALNPRATVYTNDPDDTTDYGKITAALDSNTMYAYLTLIRKAIKHDKPVRWKVDNKNFFVGGKRTETPTVVSGLIVGRDEDGTIWTTVSAPRRPNIKFVFGPSEFHSITETDGAQMDRAALSQVYAEAFVDRVSQMLAILLVDLYKAPPPRDQQGGGGGGSTNTADDDIPW